MRILVTAPHPDDEVLGCGGTIAYRSQLGDDISLCIVTKTYSPDWPDDWDRKKKEAVKKSCDILGIKNTSFLDYPAVKLDTYPQKELNQRLMEVIKSVAPKVVYLPFRGDINADHRIVFDASMVALRPLRGCVVRKILSYEVLSETEWVAPLVGNTFVPNVYCDITFTLKKKLEAMSAYDMELKDSPHPRSLEIIEALAKLRGSTIGVDSAESFMLIRERN